MTNLEFFPQQKLFRLDEDTGHVIVSAALDRDRASRITYDLMVVDTNANPQQSGNGKYNQSFLQYLVVLKGLKFNK